MQSFNAARSLKGEGRWFRPEVQSRDMCEEELAEVN